MSGLELAQPMVRPQVLVCWLFLKRPLLFSIALPMVFCDNYWSQRMSPSETFLGNASRKGQELEWRPRLTGGLCAREGGGCAPPTLADPRHPAHFSPRGFCGLSAPAWGVLCALSSGTGRGTLLQMLSPRCCRGQEAGIWTPMVCHCLPGQLLAAADSCGRRG